MHWEIFTSAIAVMVESRFSTAMGNFCARSRSMCPSIEMPRVLPSATSRPRMLKAHRRRARPGRSVSRRDRGRFYSADAYPGRIYKLTLEGTLLGVLGEAGKQLKQFGWIHEMACPSENELYVAEVLNWRVQKLILRPGQETAMVRYGVVPS